MTTGVGGEQPLASKYLEESRVWYGWLGRLYAAMVPAAVLTLIGLMLRSAIMTLVSLAWILVLAHAAWIMEKKAGKKLDGVCYHLRREINRYGGKEGRRDWRYFRLKIGDFDFQVSFLPYAASGGQRGATCLQFPKLDGSLEHVMSEVKAYCRKFENYARDL